MKHLLIIIFVTFSNIIVLSQQQESSNILLSYSQNQEIYYYEYQPKLKIKATLTQQSDVKNEYPEELIQSVFSARNQEWIDYNTLGGAEKSDKKSEKHFNHIKKMDKDKNYFELHHKVTFNLDGVKTSIIKFFLIQENKTPISGAMLMQKINNRWYVTSRSDMSMFVIMIMRLKSDALEGIIFGDSDNKEIIDFYHKVSDKNGVLNLSSFEKEFFDLYLPENKEKLNLFIDPKTW